MAKAITQGNLVMIAELMVQSRRSQIKAVGIGEQSAIAFKLAVNVLVSRNLSSRQARDRAYGESVCQNLSTHICGQSRLAGQAWDSMRYTGCQGADDRALVIEYVGFRSKDAGVGQERHSVLRIAQETFKRAIEKRFVL